MFMVKQKDTMSYREDKDIWIEKVPVPIPVRAEAAVGRPKAWNTK